MGIYWGYTGIKEKDTIFLQVGHNLSSRKGSYRGLLRWGMKGDARSLDYGSYGYRSWLLADGRGGHLHELGNGSFTRVCSLLVHGDALKMQHDSAEHNCPSS